MILLIFGFLADVHTTSWFALVWFICMVCLVVSIDLVDDETLSYSLCFLTHVFIIQISEWSCWISISTALPFSQYWTTIAAYSLTGNDQKPLCVTWNQRYLYALLIDNMSMHLFQYSVELWTWTLVSHKFVMPDDVHRSYGILFINFTCSLKVTWTFVSKVNCITSFEQKGIWFCPFKFWIIIFKYLFSMSRSTLDELICVLHMDTTNIHHFVANIFHLS